jgi:hypothetical protein
MVAEIRAARGRLGRMESLLAALREAGENASAAEEQDADMPPENSRAAESVATAGIGEATVVAVAAGGDPPPAETADTVGGSEVAPSENGQAASAANGICNNGPAADGTASNDTATNVAAADGTTTNDTASNVAATNGVANNGAANKVAASSPDATDSGASGSAADTASPPSALREQFDVRMVRDHAEQFAPYQSLLVEWVRAELLPLDKLGLGPTPDQASVAPVDEPEGHYRIQWTWPEERLADQCIAAVCAAEPSADEDPEKVSSHWREAITREAWVSGGQTRLIPVDRAWEGACVVVWAVVDLGFAKLFSRPLVLGQIGGRSRWKWTRLFSRRTEEDAV